MACIFLMIVSFKTENKFTNILYMYIILHFAPNTESNPGYCP